MWSLCLCFSLTFSIFHNLHSTVIVLHYFFSRPNSSCGSFPLQVFLTPGHQPPGLRRLRADGDRIQHLPGGGATARLFHHSAQTGLDHHGEGTSVFIMRCFSFPGRIAVNRGGTTSYHLLLLSTSVPNEPPFRRVWVSSRCLLSFFPFLANT